MSLSASGFTATTQMFTCTGFKEALDQATNETIGDVKAAIRSALNKMVGQLRTLVSQEIRKIYNVPKQILDERLQVLSARIQNLEVELTVGGKSVPLSYFNMVATKGTSRSSVKLKKTARGTRGRLETKTMKRSAVEQKITVEVIRGRRTTLTKAAFVAVMKSGHIGVMHRGAGTMKSRANSRGVKHRQAIYENAVVSIATMFHQSGVNDALIALIDNKLEALFNHELEFYLGRGAQ